MSLTIRPASSCAFDQLSLGEVMLRLDPGEGRVRTARSFTAWEGGGEYNTSRGLRKCFGLKTAVCTAFVDNEVGHLVEDFIMQGGVATDFIKWREDDGIGRTVRNGLNFTERGFGIRGAVGVPDRGNTAASQLKPGDFDWDHIFGKLGVRWFHTGGIFAALSETTAALTVEAVKAANKHGTIVSYDLNYRPSLWKTIGGLKKAQEVNREIAKYVDVMIGNEEDFTASLGFAVKGAEDLKHIETAAFKAMIETAVKEFPNFKVAATTLRKATTATLNVLRGGAARRVRLVRVDGSTREGDYDTLSGFLLEYAREIPAPGTTIEVEGIKFTIQRATPQVIQEVQIRW